MIAIAVLAAAQCRSTSLPTERRNRQPMALQGRRPVPNRSPHARLSRVRPQKTSSTAFRPRTMPAKGRRTPTSAPPAILKSP